MNTPSQIVKGMLQNDAFSQWLQLELVEIKLGHCVLRMCVRAEMLNGFAIAHGGIVYALCDSTFAFAANSRKEKTPSVETSITHIRPVFEGDILTATAYEKYRGKTIGVYHVEVYNQHEKMVALFKGMVVN